MKSNNIKIRNLKNKIFHISIFFVTCIGIIALVVLFIDIFKKGLPWLTGSFITGMPSMFPEKAGIYPGLIGSLYLIGLTVLIAVPIGLGCAIYLEEYAKPGKLTSFIKINISNLAGTPSIVYGLLGLAIFVKQLQLGRSILAGALTMALVVLPIVIVSSQEALKTVSQVIRHGSYAMGATKWQTIRKVVIPCALPGILTGVILSISRAIGETAPIIMVGAFAFVATTPTGIMDSFSAIPVLIYSWISLSKEEFQSVAAAGIIVLLAVLLSTNAIAIFLRNKFQKTYE